MPVGIMFGGRGVMICAGTTTRDSRRRALQGACNVSPVQFIPSVEDHASFAVCDPTIPAIKYILLLKTIVVPLSRPAEYPKELLPHGDDADTCDQCAPSLEFQTSERGEIALEPNIQILLL
jgi:hypothetical protein